MVNILAFPGKPSSKTSQQDSFDREATKPLVASTLDGTLVVARDTSSQGRSGDWINQELADLYRVEALLVQAGIRISTGRGLTDENEPWFVFCRNDGEVFVHLARINGAYLLDSPGLGTLLEGSDFASLIDRFVQQVAARNEPDSNVVRFRPQMLHDRTVRLHPAVMLAALVWSLYLASDDLIGTAEAAESLAADGGSIPQNIMDIGKNGAAFELDVDFAEGHLPSPETLTTLHGASLIAPSSSDRQTVSFQESLRVQQNLDARGLGIAQPTPAVLSQAITASLAVIAFGYGFNGTHSVTGLTSVATDKAVATLHLLLEQLADAKPSPFVVEADGSPIELAANTTDKTEVPDVTMKLTLQDNGLYKAPISTSADEETAHATASEKTVPVIIQGDDNVSAKSVGKTVSLETHDKAPAETHVTVVTTPKVYTDSQKLISFVSEYSGPFIHYSIDGVAVSATLDEKDLDKVLLQISDVESGSATDQGSTPVNLPIVLIAEQQGKSGGGGNFAIYDDQAKKFVHDFIVDAGSIEMLQVSNELMLVDMTAIDEPTDHAFVRSWLTDDGHVISTIGHYQVFMDYGFV